VASCLEREAHLECEQEPLGMALIPSETARGIAMQGPFEASPSPSRQPQIHSQPLSIPASRALRNHRNCATHIHLSLVWRNSTGICGAIAAKFL